MEWHDEGLIIGLRRYGETGAILEVFTPAHGRHFGLVRGGFGRRLRALLQPGNQADFTWRARLDQQLGLLAVEPTKLMTTRLFASGLALQGMNLIAALLRLLPERDPHPELYAVVRVLLEHLDEPAVAPILLARFELAMLTETGFGLDLSACAATGATQELIYVSPKSGRAVSARAGAPYHDKLLGLPPFFLDGSLLKNPTLEEVEAGFALTGHFLMRDLFGPRGQTLPDARHAFLAETAKTYPRVAPQCF
ncbi:DNA repair protein RecO [Beijerinckia indica]|uniref:DNA repair protein RecO n=1 Tax=Beijerinckia indica subsp. indica (strain ATCC 9039 / DSM 1715 / NCIMB 8712) TaxID=395963 RepID=RECO_BEII9|nr:DNA repair protein RecO [Beijerinckia indica]B2IBG3.1 RecName: Full=DNA repair protein RecO; AltName: Full=Recombination protein O [Beijerinckia indica subsp. indica ATCC 9039]ACB96589.1 DNA repair protein RecO [Beijerinckia indica subsp. indica ATCC 9039]